MYIWIIISLILFSFELISTSFFLIFFGFASLVVAFLTKLYLISLANQILIFCLLSIIFFFIGEKLFKNKKNEKLTIDIDDDLIGRTGIAKEDAEKNGYLTILVGDTIWQAHTKETVKKNQKVKIISRENLILEIKPL